MDLTEIEARLRSHRQRSGKLSWLSDLREFVQLVSDVPGEAHVLMDEHGIQVEWRDAPREVAG
jgi:hypothetical protein